MMMGLLSAEVDSKGLFCLVADNGFLFIRV